MLPQPPFAANWNAIFTLFHYPLDDEKAQRLSLLPKAETTSALDQSMAEDETLNHIRTALALSYAAGRTRMVEFEGCRWRANPYGSLTYCGAAGR
jgi:hypothetical protein